MTKIYIAGPMTGLPDLNYPAFHDAAAALRAAGHEVFNPAENPVPACGSWNGYMRMAIAQLTQCEAIYLLHGWSASKGARLEYRIAQDFQIKPIFQHNHRELGARDWRESFQELMGMCDRAKLRAATSLQFLPPKAITASVMREDGGERPAYCLMAAYRTEADAVEALGALGALATPPQQVPAQAPAAEAVPEDEQLKALKAKTACCMGVGNGDGNLFVYGDYDSIKAAQALVLRAEAKAEVQAEPVAYVLGNPRYADSSNVFMSHQFTPDGEHEDEWTPLYTTPQAQPADALTQAARDVLAERHRQISAEGWTSERDDKYGPGALSDAGGCYAIQAYGGKQLPEFWPWTEEWWKPSETPRRNLEKAGALILAEIERLDRAALAVAKEGGAA